MGGIMHMLVTYGIVHAGFIGLRVLVARNKGQCKLIGNRFVIPHDTIPSTLGNSYRAASCNDFYF
jgi:mannitol/fructose-specific phosphotransferase system IIA component